MATRSFMTVVACTALHLVLGTAMAARPETSGRPDACERSARRYETRCLMPRIEARLRLERDGDPAAFVERMQEIDHACTDVTAAGLEACVAWPRVRPTAEYRRWLREINDGWQRQQVEIDGMRPACPPGVWHCL
jgi:hypothetical protein